MLGTEKVYLPRICGLAAMCCVLIGSHSGVKGVKAHVGIRACVHFLGPMDCLYVYTCWCNVCLAGFRLRGTKGQERKTTIWLPGLWDEAGYSVSGGF